ncbi:MAG: tetratricopeptide repeat protein [Bacteroidota bacterium]
MNKLILFFFAVAIAACNNNTNSNADMPEQEKKLREQIAEHPDSLVLKENLVQYFRDNNNYSQAIAETDNALQKDSTNERLWYMKATLLFENEDTLKAINAWEKLVRINAQPEYIKTLGFLYAITKHPLALGMSNLLLSAPGPTRNEGLFIQGLYYSKIGEKENAIALFDQCLSLDYKNIMAYREKAIAEYDLGKYLDALKTLELALAVQQTYDEAYYWMGRCFEKLGKKEEAVKNYQTAIQFAEGQDYPEAKDALGRMGITQ